MKSILTKQFLTEQIKTKQIKDIAKEVGCGRDTISKYCKKYGIDTSRYNKETKNAILGQKIGRLEVIGFDKDKNGHTLLKCKCICGNITSGRKHSIFGNKDKQSCGCQRQDNYKRGRGKELDRYLKRLEHNAISRNLSFSISKQNVLDKYNEQDGLCAISGIEIFFQEIGGIQNEQTVSVDRIDSSKDYTEDNIQLVHKIVNKMKGSLSQSDFDYWIKTIYINKESQ